MSFEIIVRPAAAVPVLKPGTDLDAIPETPDNPLIEWGAGPSWGSSNLGSLQGASPGGFADLENGAALSSEWTEMERTVHVKRIIDPNNAENYVDVEVIDTISFSTPGGTVVFKFNN